MPTAARRIVMLVRNPFVYESRGEREARSLTAAGYHVTVVADAGPGLPSREERTYATIRRMSIGSRRVKWLRFLMQQVRYARELLRVPADAYHAHDSDALLPVALAAFVRRVPFVFDAHELWLGRQRTGRTALYDWAYRFFYGTLERWLLPRAAAVLVVSPPIGEHLASVYAIRPAISVPNYPDQSEILADGEAVRDIRSLPGADRIPAEAPLALYLGHLMAGRGLDQLIEAIDLVPGLHLALLGHGGHEPQLRQLADRLSLDDRVHFLDPVPPELVIAYAASADIGVSPITASSLNYRYSLPNKLFQYMAAGLPVIASDFPQVREVIEAPAAGLVVDPTSPRQIADALQRLLGDRQAAARMGENARRALDHEFNWDVAARRLVAAYDAILRPAADEVG